MFDFIFNMIEGPTVRSRGCIQTYPVKMAAGKKELDKTARKAQVKLKIVKEEKLEYMVRIFWEVRGPRDSVQLFNGLLEVNDTFEVYRAK